MAESTMTKLTIPSTLAEAAKVQHVILHDAQSHGFTESACFAIRLSLDEALANAVCHGNRNDPSKQIQIEYSITDDRVAICVTDQGPGFNPRCVPDPTLDENLERPHGRGVMLMKAYMTHVSYNDKGNAVTLVKTRGCKLPER
jgi:serine/threonine-protein kinase RsbW